MSDNSSFDSLPGMVAEINKKIDLLIADRVSHSKDDDYLMTMEDLRDFLPENPARQTVYMWVNEGKIPFEKYGRRLYFRKTDIDRWISVGRQIKKM
jgi:excisionase family DNA binding protein